MMDALDAMELSEQPLSISTSWLRELRSALSRKLGRLHLSVTRGEAGARLRFQRQKFDGLRKRELLTLLRSAQRVTGRFQDIEIAKLGEDIFCIYK
jgi:hypothetical protein